MIVGDLFSGIGGFSLAARWLGWRTAWFAEIDPYASRVLAQHWPGVPNHGDVRTVDWRSVDRPDVLCGGFPCQPHSLAGKRAGSADDRDLWPEFRRAVRVLRPSYILAENVPGLFASDGGRFFNRILSDLAELGYDAEWTVLSAQDVGAPHLRERVWIVVYPSGGGQPVCRSSSGRSGFPALGGQDLADPNSSGPPHDREGNPRLGGGPGRDPAGPGGAPVPNTYGRPDRRLHGGGREGSGALSHPEGPGLEGPEPAGNPCPDGCAGEYGPGGWSADWWAVEPDVGRVAHGIPARVDRLKGLGNAIVPRCAWAIFSRIELHHRGLIGLPLLGS